VVALDYGIPTDKEGIQLRLGVSRGFFRDEGIDLNIKIVFGGPEIAAAYDSGTLKVGELGTPPGLTAISNGHRFRIVGSGIRGRAVQYFVARPEIKEWSDLAGTTAAALSIGSCSYWFARLVLQQRGLDPDRDLNLVGLGSRYPKVLELFDQRELAAAVISEPNVSLGESKGLFRILQALTDPEFCPAMQWSIVVANNQFIASEPELIRAVFRAARRSNEYCRDNPDEWARFAADWYGVEYETMAKANARELDSLRWNCVPDLPGIQQAIDLQVRLGAIAVPPKVEEIVDLRFLPPT
jgi:NitT/TauT family transport system substrate-binding protein